MKTLYLICLLPCLAAAQNYKEDLRVALQNISSQKNYSMRVHYRVYLDNNTSKAFEESYIDLKRNATGMLYKQSEGIEMMCNSQYEISVNAGTHVMTARRKTQSIDTYTKRFLDETQRQLDAVTNTCQEIKLLDDTKTRTIYRLEFKAGQPMESMIVHFDKQKKVLVKVQYKYREAIEISELNNSLHKAMFEITYENMDLTSTVNPGLFDEKKYVSVTNGKMKLASRYKSYTLQILN